MPESTKFPSARLAPLFLAFALLAPGARAADMAVIVNPQNGVEQLSKSQVINIFLASNREFPDSASASPIDMRFDSPENTRFYRALVNREPEQMQAYWARLVFSGKAAPPARVAGWQDVIQTVASNRSAIGYVDMEHVDPAQVKVVYVLPLPSPAPIH